MPWLHLDQEIASEFAELADLEPTGGPHSWASLLYSAAEQRLAKRASRATVQCTCGAVFVPVRAGTKYCSDRCKRRHWDLRTPAASRRRHLRWNTVQRRAALAARQPIRCRRPDCTSGPFVPLHGITRYCSARCQAIVNWRACCAARTARRRSLTASDGAELW